MTRTPVQPKHRSFSLGVDYGTNSVRALIVDTADGRDVATHLYPYPSGDAGILLDPRDPNVARQNPRDYIHGFIAAVREAVKKARRVKGFKPERIIGIGVDTTGSTPIPVGKDGKPLAFKREFKSDLAAHAWLWKDHTSYAEAAEITDKAGRYTTKYLDKCGGTYSSEWYWSKILHCKRIAPKVFKAAYAWVELVDFVPGYITGNTDPHTMPRSICAAGHKAMYHDDWDGLPSAEFLRSLDPALASLRDRYAKRALASDQKAGELTSDVAKKVGLPAGIPVAVGAFDAHHGAIGSGVREGTLVKIIGTSTCDIMVAPAPGSPGNPGNKGGGKQKLADIPGVCGIVLGSVIPGMYGLEAGQSAVGDIFNWFVRHLGKEGHEQLTRDAAKLRPGESGLVALDWNNGNRTVLVDPLLTGLLVGQTLHTTAAEIYRALVEATAFGALTIINRFEQFGVKVKEVVNCGGISEKNAMVMQVYADVCGRPMKIADSSQTCALGAAIFGAVVGGAYQDTGIAIRKMTRVKKTIFRPQAANAATYAKLYQLYLQLHDGFGGVGHAKPASMANVMKDLLAIRRDARRGKRHA